MARETISISSEVDSPQASEAALKRARPAMKTRRRPSRSPARPPSSRKPPKASVYAQTTHCRFSCEKWRSDWIEGSATFTIATSSTIMNCVTTSSPSAIQRFGSGVDGCVHEWGDLLEGGRGRGPGTPVATTYSRRAFRDPQCGCPYACGHGCRYRSATGWPPCPRPRSDAWPLAAARIAAGLVFLGFSLGKFRRHQAEVDAFDRYGLPFPDAFVYAVGTLELVGGALLVLGLATRLVALALAGNMVGAILTAGREDGGLVNLGLAPLLLLTLLTLLWAGAVRPSLDARLAQPLAQARLRAQRPGNATRPNGQSRSSQARTLASRWASRASASGSSRTHSRTSASAPGSSVGST